MCVVVLCTSCASSKKVVYLQDVVPLKQQVIEQKYEVYIHNDDLLAIMVNSKNPELALPFNMPMVSYQLGKVMLFSCPSKRGYQQGCSH